MALKLLNKYIFTSFSHAKNSGKSSLFCTSFKLDIQGVARASPISLE